jgi:hypothetical protein
MVILPKIASENALTFRLPCGMIGTRKREEMPMKTLKEIDKNFTPERLGDREYIFRDCRQAPFRIYGLMWPTEDTPYFHRLPQAVADRVNDGVAALCCNTAGGRLRFRTDSSWIAVRVQMKSVMKAPHFPLTGTAGLDLYADGIYRNTFVPNFEKENYFEATVDLKSRENREILIHFPLYSGVTKLEIGLEPEATLEASPEYRPGKPVVYYGSSITQGGCASRPGNAYTNILSRELNCDHVNLGFSGSARAEEEMIRYLTRQEMSVFVMDYDHNAPNPAFLEATHEKLYRAFRAAQPETPIVMATMPKVFPSEDSRRRQAVIRATYEKALAEGDTRVRYVDGTAMMALLDFDGGLVDNCHPNDLGFLCMARAFGPVIKELLEL